MSPGNPKEPISGRLFGRKQLHSQRIGVCEHRRQDDARALSLALVRCGQRWCRQRYVFRESTATWAY